jgi:hypothetical protein
MTRTVPLALIVTLLAGCGSAGSGNNSIGGAFEDGFKEGFRKNFVSQCIVGAQKASGNATKDFSAVCGCVADKVMAGKSATQLMTPPTADEDRQYAAECKSGHPGA